MFLDKVITKIKLFSFLFYSFSSFTLPRFLSSPKQLRVEGKRGFSRGSVVKNLPANAGDAGHVKSIPGGRRSLGGEDPLEEEMTTHSSILAWKISWTEEPGRQFMGLQRVGHD